MNGVMMTEIWYETLNELRAEPLTAVWLAGNALGFLCTALLLIVA